MNSTPTWVTLVVAALGLLGTLLGAFASPLLAGRSAAALAKLRRQWEIDRQQTEDAFRQEDRRRDRTKLLFETKSSVFATGVRLATERTEALRKANARTASGESSGLKIPTEHWQAEWSSIVARTQLLDPEVARRMDSWDTQVLIDEVNLERIEPKQIPIDDIATYGRKNLGKTSDRYNAMLAAMRRSLGVEDA